MSNPNPNENEALVSTKFPFWGKPEGPTYVIKGPMSLHKGPINIFKGPGSHIVRRVNFSIFSISFLF